jgi:glucose/mannose-6-phosphate isomerase
MIEDFKKFKEVFEEASKLGKDIKLPKYDKIILCGIGGSALPGDVIQGLDLDVPVFVAREILPEIADDKTLCFIISYSGNTIETIKLYQQAKEKNCKLIVITSGGAMKTFKESKILIPGGYLPREAFLWMLLPVLNILGIHYSKNIKIDFDKIKQFANRINKKTPLIYAGAENLAFLAYRWKTFFEENCKIVASSGFFPEINHNEIESRFSREGFQGILVYDSMKDSVKYFEEIVKISFIEVELKGKYFIDKIIYGLYFGYMLSYFLAQTLGVDYKKIDRIKTLKSKLK